MTGPQISFRDVGVTVGSTTLLEGIDLTVAAGSWTSIIGPNGAGKTTLLQCLAGLTNHTGTISIGDEQNATLTSRDRAKVVALVPQSPVVPPGIVVANYVLLGRTPHQGMRFSASANDEHVVNETLDRLDLTRFADRRLETLSGGERQRVVLARALVQSTDVLVLDEPTTGLDIGHQFDVLELVAELGSERGLTIISTLHDLPIAGQFSDQLALLSNGSLVSSGTPAQVITADNLADHYNIDAHVQHSNGEVSITVRRRKGASISAAPTETP